MSYRSFVPRHPESVFTLLLLWTFLAVPSSRAGQGYIVRYDNDTHLEATLHYLGVHGAGINCWYQKDQPDSKDVDALDHTDGYYTERRNSQACFNVPNDHYKFALLAETADGRQRVLEVFDTGDDTGDPRKDCFHTPFFGTPYCPLIQTDSHFGHSELFVTVSDDLGDDSDRYSHQAIGVVRAGPLNLGPVQVLYQVASELSLDGENLTGSSRSAETVYKIRVTAPVFSVSLGAFNNRLLEAFTIEGTNDDPTGDDVTWNDLGRLLPSDNGVLEPEDQGHRYGSGDAVLYYQPSAEASYRYLQVSQCTMARDGFTDDPVCSSATVDLEGLDPPFSTGSPPDLSQITIALEPTKPQGGSEASVTANGLAQEEIQVTLFDGDGNPIHTDNPTLGQLYDLLYFLDSTTETLITNLHDKDGFSSLSDLEGPYTALLGAGERGKEAHRKVGARTHSPDKSTRVVPPSTYYFTTTLAQENSIAVRLRIDDQVVCPPEEAFEGGGCQASISGQMPDLAVSESSTTHMRFNNELAKPSETAALTYVAQIHQDEPVVGVISEYEVFIYCPDDDDNDLEKIGASTAKPESSDLKTLSIDHHKSCCKSFATTVIDVYGTSLAPRASPASCSSEADFGATGTWGRSR